MQGRAEQTTSLEARLAEPSNRLTVQAKALPFGERDPLLRRTRQAEATMKLNGWLIRLACAPNKMTDCRAYRVATRRCRRLFGSVGHTELSRRAPACLSETAQGLRMFLGALH